MKLNKKQKGI